MIARKGIILAGGSGTRLHPITIGVSKQLLPIYDKPMVYYPLSVLMLAGIRQIAIITNPEYINQFKRLLKDGSQWGIEFTYIEQPSPDGLAQAYLLADGFLNGAPSALILGDNIFYGDNFSDLLKTADAKTSGGSIFGYRVTDPERYGVIGFDEHGHTNSIVEKPKTPRSNYAVTGLYFLDATASERAKSIKPSQRGELEITSLLETYLDDGSLDVQKMGRGFAWLDTGTHDSLLDAGNLVRTLQKRQGLLVGSPDEIAFDNGWITESELNVISAQFQKNDYGNQLDKLINS
jgi:glucose-1-phosphate thymidylyltransferase